MQLPLQSCWPLTVQVQVPPLQDEPLPQAVQLVPQWAASVFELQAPSEHNGAPPHATHAPSMHVDLDGQIRLHMPQSELFAGPEHCPSEQIGPDGHGDPPVPGTPPEPAPPVSVAPPVARPPVLDEVPPAPPFAAPILPAAPPAPGVPPLPPSSIRAVTSPQPASRARMADMTSGLIGSRSPRVAG
jgi:hypothetical protein